MRAIFLGEVGRVVFFKHILKKSSGKFEILQKIGGKLEILPLKNSSKIFANFIYKIPKVQILKN